jgi:hypothetical protein
MPIGNEVPSLCKRNQMKKISVIQTWTETNHPMPMTAHHLQKAVFLFIAKELLKKS